jgi:MYXO-CTERM domain-containing protein
VQDNCAHSGMGNPEHSWRSLSDLCSGTQISPDIQPAALDCARWETDAVMSAVFSVLEDNGAEKAALDDVEHHANHMVNYGDACHFLGEAGDWDGVDRRWDNDIVRPFLRNELISAITSDGAQHGWVCDSAPDGILVSYDEDVDVSGGADSCVLIHGFCLGKADEVTGPQTKSSSSGCDVSGAPAASALPLALLMFAVALRLARRNFPNV